MPFLHLTMHAQNFQVIDGICACHGIVERQLESAESSRKASRVSQRMVIVVFHEGAVKSSIVSKVATPESLPHSERNIFVLPVFFIEMYVSPELICHTDKVQWWLFRVCLISKDISGTVCTAM